MKIMAKLEKVGNIKGQYTFWCPGCQCGHKVNIESEGSTHPVWSLSGSLDNPTISPSICVTTKWSVPSFKAKVCHLFIRNGKIEYLPDCTHELAGKTVDMVDLEQIL